MMGLKTKNKPTLDLLSFKVHSPFTDILRKHQKEFDERKDKIVLRSNFNKRRRFSMPHPPTNLLLKRQVSPDIDLRKDDTLKNLPKINRRASSAFVNTAKIVNFSFCVRERKKSHAYILTTRFA